MHIEPGVVEGAKLLLSYTTAVAAFGLTAKLALDSVRTNGGAAALAVRSLLTTVLVFCFFEVLPHHPVGVSEVHLILGSTLLLLFGAGATAVGLAVGLLLQGLFFAQFDLPQYGMNVTTLLVPLWGIHLLAKRIIPARTAYVDTSYKQALALSTAYQGGIVAWVAFWAFYGNGFSSDNLASVGSFGLAYMSVILIEPLIDLGVLAGAKALARYSKGPLFNARLHQPA
ncbi:MAG: energy-coupling factor ABC transporter permease [Gammaproteobacteria bacterium]|nr:energy-coupling factor ABC transporter permease [Gammaproteobacteria bacterium]MBU1490792.1 energy-coupling factor ABC transporter permease [Gammaproteobacteria bacterium]MBU2065567.1 energy-coupling factor ABC transporter permease [Gammaproteobacteria bacterium]MBU2140822.1 energy-coupling factor ABC transporter permease [Gammaproteobacteria bacterium]MBU2217314.1 energy-coupling factor ABC transporter permease [Gammaproteobacteria bacterium]